MIRLIIFANGLVPDIDSARNIIKPDDILLAADGGTRNALALGVLPSVVIGDLDSLTSEERQQLDANGTEIQQFSSNKNQTDLELALDYAARGGYQDIIIIGALGGRLDQTIGNLSLLSDPRFSTLKARMDDGVEEAFFISQSYELQGKVGEIVSLIPWGGGVTGIHTEGLRWPLHGEDLQPNKTRGISNEMLNKIAVISISSGLLLCIHRRKKKINHNQALEYGYP